MPLRKSLGRLISAMNSGKIMDPPYEYTACMAPLSEAAKLPESGRAALCWTGGYVPLTGVTSAGSME